MRKYSKYLLFVFFVSLFSFINNVFADYKATVINPVGAHCDLYKKESTGYCYYSDSNLNAYTKGVIWLDTTDEVTVLEDYDKIDSTDELCSDYYVYTSYYYLRTNITYNGYYCNANLKVKEDISEELKHEFEEEGFPESYYEKLSVLKSAHPSWTFKAIDTKLKFSDAVNGEMKLGHTLVTVGGSNNYAYFSTSPQSFDYYNDHFIERDRIGGSNPWCDANYDAIAYYLDPRNFLNDMYIFQFMGLSYDTSFSDETYINLINEVFKGDYLSKFSEDFLNAGKESGVSPIYLSSLSRQEIANGDTPGTAISGTYNGMYNFYNIGAVGGVNPALNGLDYASKLDPSTLRPWDTEYKAIVGGALWMNDKYISMGQDTSYFKKWNVIYNYLKDTNKVSNPYTNFNHEYMTSIMAPSSEAVITYRSYYSYGLLDSGFIFYIPVFSDMPESTELPTKGGWPNNYLSSILINDVKIAEFDGGIEEYNYYLDINKPTIKIGAYPVNNTATIEGIGEFVIEEDQTLTISVKAENGNIKNYNINVFLTGTKIEVPVDVQTTLNNAGIKNGDRYLSGFSINTNISVIKDKIISANSDAIVTLFDKNSNEKNSGNIYTGDLVTVTVNDQSKTYEIVLYGDCNGDGEIDALDYVKLRKYIMGSATIEDSYKEAADVNKDGIVDAIDYVRLRKYIMNTATIEQ